MVTIHMPNFTAQWSKVVTVAVALLTVGACGSSGNTASPNAPSSGPATGQAQQPASSAAAPQERKKLHLAGVLGQVTDPYYVTLKCGGTAAANKLGVDLQWAGSASPDVSTQENILSSVLLTNPDGVILDPFSPTAFIAPVQKLMKSGTPVILVDTELSKPVAQQAFYTDNTAAGQTLAKPLAAALGGVGQVAIISSSPGDPFETARYKGFEQALSKIAPKIEVLPIQYAALDSSKGASITTSLVLAHPKLSAIYVTDGLAAPGAASALLAAGKRGKVKLIAFDAEPVEVQGLKSGAYQGLVAQAPYVEGYDTVTALVGYLRAHGDKSAVVPADPYYTSTPAMFLDASNVDSSAAKSFLYNSNCS